MAAPADLAPTDVATRAWNGAVRYLAAGTTAIRVHVDIGQESGRRAVEALLEVRAGLAGILDIQIVAAASALLTGLTGATSRARLRHALAAGADLARAGPGSLARLTAIARAWFGYPLAVSHAASFRDEEEGTATARSSRPARRITRTRSARPRASWRLA